MTKTFYLIFTLFLISAFGLAACGGSSTASQPSSSQDSGSQAQAAEEEAAAPSGDPEAGKQLFSGTCSACHGPEGKGIQGLGKDMTSSEFIASKSDSELVDFIKVGRDPSDPLNTTGVAMPPKGGNPALDDEDLLNIIAFIRTLQK